MPRTALIVVIAEAEPVVGDWRMRYDNASLGVPAHVTLLFPFVPAEEADDAIRAELRELFASQPSFSFSLPRVARFPEVAWLAPEPDEPFRRLTELIFDRYPDYPPYEGIHDEVIPHLTVGVGDQALQDEIDAALTPSLPIEAEAQEVTLLVEDESGQWSIGHRFPLEASSLWPESRFRPSRSSC
jgi:2'-5' RNA ligase